MRFWPLIVVAAAYAACEDADPRPPVTYTGRIEPLLAARCAECHGDSAPAGGYSVANYIRAVGCVGDVRPATVGANGARPPILAVLDRADHAHLLDATERAALATWVAEGTTRSGGGVHPAGFADPRSPDSHARYLRLRRYAPMTDPLDADSCAVCHDAARQAPGAPLCASCHTEPAGTLACGTCHGDGARVYPPRSACFHPEEKVDAHAVHAGPSSSRAAGLPCTACHPTPAMGAPGGVHANGYLDIAFDFAVAGNAARFDPNGVRCSGTCHARGGNRPAPAWTEAAMTCNDCHLSPPPNHYRGACTSCHREANADGTAIANGTLHVNGKVDLGDGSGRCGACHGSGDDPWPSTGAHAAHRAPGSSRAVPCATCHEVPAGGERHPEGRGFGAVRFAGLAVRGGRRPTYDAATKTCAGTYCHEGLGATAPAPRWSDGPTTCASCHASPPPPPHPQSATCTGSSCHEGRVENGAVTAGARSEHVDGFLQHVLR